MKMEKTFARLLSEAIHRIRLQEGKSVQIVQDELGFALGRDGGSAIRYWRKGHVPAQPEDVAQLAQELVQRGQLERNWLEQFLRSADYGPMTELVTKLFPNTAVKANSALPPDQALNVTVDVAEMTPFLAGPPLTHPYHFFGRRRELRRIFGLLGRFPLQHTAVIGPYRSGKTSLLHYLRAIHTTPNDQLRPDQKQNWLSHSDQYRWVFVDFQDMRMHTPAGLLTHILRGLQMPLPRDAASVTISQFMTIVSRQIMRDQRPTIILLDEIGAGLQASELDLPFWWSLRSLVSNQAGGKLAFILAAHEHPAQLAQSVGKPSPFFNIFGHMLRLGPLLEPEARALIQSTPLPFPEPDVEWIMAHSGRWPSLLQILCQERLIALEDEDDSDEWRTFGLEQIEPYRHLLNE
jgi:hypothetical protein